MLRIKKYFILIMSFIKIKKKTQLYTYRHTICRILSLKCNYERIFFNHICTMKIIRLSLKVSVTLFIV